MRRGIVSRPNKHVEISNHNNPYLIHGKTIDCGEDSEVCMTVQRVNNYTFTGTFTSPTYDGQGSIKLTFLPSENKLQLKITEGFKEYYLPNNAKYEN